jgi:hypothetical protein
VTHLGANPLTSVSVATVPTTRRRSTIHTPQEGPSLFPEQRLLLANASRGGGCQWCPLEKMSLKGTSNTRCGGATLPLLRRTADAINLGRMREKMECVHLFILASELHPEMLVGSRRRAYTSTYFGAT